MSEETVTVDAFGTELQVSEIDGGFVVEEADDDPDLDGLYIRFESHNYGCEIPLDAEFEVSQDNDFSSDVFNVAWNDEDDISDLQTNDRMTFGSSSDLDSAARVNEAEIVQY